MTARADYLLRDHFDPRKGFSPQLTLSLSEATNTAFMLNGFERDLLFRNDGKGFQNLAALSGMDSVVDGRSFAVGDVDRDGDLDVIVKNLQWKLLQLYENRATGGNRGLFVRCRGTRSNRDGIGTRLVIEHGGRRQMAEVRSANSFQSQSPNEVFFGLGSDERADRLEVTWISGTKQSFEGLEAGKYYVIDEDEGVVEERALHPLGRELPADDPRKVGRTSIFRSPRRASGFDIKTASGKMILSKELFRKPTLVSFLTTWLADYDDYLAMLGEIKEHFPELNVVVLLVRSPTVEAKPEAVERAKEYPFDVARVGYDMAAGYARQSNVLFPSSFLVVDSTVVCDMIGNVEKRRVGAAVEFFLGRK